MTEKEIAIWNRAASIPDLGGGGATVAPTLVDLAQNVPNKTAIVDIGPWFGSTTAYLAMGLVGGGREDVSIHSYDRWEATYKMSKSVFRRHKIKLKDGGCFWKLWAANVLDLPVDIVPHEGDVYLSDPPDRPISMIVDDVSSGELALMAMFDLFGPQLMEGAPVVMMDYGFHRAKPHVGEFHETVDFFRDRREMFAGPYDIAGARNVAALFCYQGGWV